MSVEELTFECAIAGMNDVLPKPFTKENLLSMLEVRLSFASTAVERVAD